MLTQAGVPEAPNTKSLFCHTKGYGMENTRNRFAYAIWLNTRLATPMTRKSGKFQAAVLGASALAIERFLWQSTCYNTCPNGQGA